MNKSDANPTVTGACLAIAGDLPSEGIASVLRSFGYTPEINWTLLTEKVASSEDAAQGFSSVIELDDYILDIGETLNKILRKESVFHHVALIMGNDATEADFTKHVVLGANIPAKHRLVIQGGKTYPLNKYINIHCKPSEKDWAESDGETIACTLYGHIGKKSSGLHSVFLGKSAYERFIDSYYLDDLLKTKYKGYQPEKFYFILYFALVCYQKAKINAAFTELGATLWGTIDKIEICHLQLDLPYSVNGVEWNSIELSDYLRQLSHLLHPNLNLNYFDKWKNYYRKDVEIGFSHLVSPYALHDEKSTIDWIKSFEFCLFVSDFTLTSLRHLKVNGKTWTLLPLKSLVENLRKANFGIYLIDARDLDPERQIKRTSLVIYNREKFSIDQYISLINSPENQSPVSINDFRNLDFDPANLWDKLVDDPNYFTKCAESFSAGFAGALAITPTGPYEFKWSSSKLASRVKEHLELVSKDICRDKSSLRYIHRLKRFFSIN